MAVLLTCVLLVIAMVPESVGDGRWSTDPAKDDQNVPVEKKGDALDVLDIKYEVKSI